MGPKTVDWFEKKLDDEPKGVWPKNGCPLAELELELELLENEEDDSENPPEL